jgi:uncharacterized protein (TIGR03435 family)
MIMIRWAFITALLYMGADLFSQTIEQPLSFEVATIKPAAALAGVESYCRGGPGTNAPGQISCANYTLEGYVRRAYDRNESWELVFPRSIPDDRYDVLVKVPPGATIDQLNLMFQNLLAERFGLVLHTEKRIMRSYKLVAAKNGLKIAPQKSHPEQTQGRSASALLPPSMMPKDKDGWPILPPDSRGIFVAEIRGYSRVMFREQPLSELTKILQRLLREPVINETGLTGLFSFEVTVAWPSWTDAFSARQLSVPNLGDDLPGAANEGPLMTNPRSDMNPLVERILAALERQLGLKVVLGKGPVEVLIVDEASAKPTEN